MGLYISGMKMPVAGQEIEFAEGINGNIYARIKCLFGEAEWHTVFPIYGHGSLVDKDKLGIYELEEKWWLEKEFAKPDDDEYLDGLCDGLHMAAKALSTAETVIPEEKE